MAMKDRLVTGRTTASATPNTATQLTSTSTKVSSVVLQCEANQVVIIGDSNVAGPLSAARGMVLADGSGSAGSVVSLTIDAIEADGMGLHMASGQGYIDLSDIWFTSDAASDPVWWLAQRRS